jgi:hypothetical protein
MRLRERPGEALDGHRPDRHPRPRLEGREDEDDDYFRNYYAGGDPLSVGRARRKPARRGHGAVAAMARPRVPLPKGFRDEHGGYLVDGTGPLDYSDGPNDLSKPEDHADDPEYAQWRAQQRRQHPAPGVDPTADDAAPAGGADRPHGELSIGTGPGGSGNAGTSSDG